MSKQKGSRAERELVSMFWAKGWAALRTAGSGSTQFPAPDILVANGVRRLAIEVKSTKEKDKYFPHEEIHQLTVFAQYFGAEAWLGVRFGPTWSFCTPDDLEPTKTQFVLRKNSMKSLTFEETIGDL